MPPVIPVASLNRSSDDDSIVCEDQGTSNRTLLLDTNVLLLLFVGLWDRSRIQNFKRTEQFTED